MYSVFYISFHAIAHDDCTGGGKNNKPRDVCFFLFLLLHFLPLVEPCTFTEIYLQSAMAPGQVRRIYFFDNNA